MHGELAPLFERVRDAAAAQPPVDVFYAIWRDPYMTVGADTYVHDMLAVCGGRNVFDDPPGRYPTGPPDEGPARRAGGVLPPPQTFRLRRVHPKDIQQYAFLPPVSAG